MGSGLLIVAGLLPVGSAAAQTDAAKPDDVVVVARPRRSPDQQARDFVSALTPTLGNDPLVRFDTDKLCPLAIGLGAPYDGAITDRMRRVATAAGITVAARDCRRSNALVIFADDRAAAVALLEKRYPWLFLDRFGQPIRLRKEEVPVVAWHLDQEVDRDGMPLQRGPDGFYESRTAAPPSRLQASARSVFEMTFVVIEKRAVQGLTVTQIADYAAMRTLADTRPDRAVRAGVPTILTVIGTPVGGETPRSVTAWDLGLLRGLYAAPPNSYADAQKGAIAGTVKRQVEAQGSGDR